MSLRTRRRGFTLIELMIVTVIVGILAGLALPTYQNMILKARAARVLQEFDVVKLAAYTYFADHNTWPPDVNRGIVPPGLKPYLPDNFSFVRDSYKLDWENWATPDGTPLNPNTGVIVGISVVTTDTDLGNALMGLLGNTHVHYTIGDHYTFMLVGT